MKVLIDARELDGRPTGVGRYLAELLDQWTIRPPERAEVVLCAPRVTIAGGRWPFRRLETGGRASTAWEQWTLPQAIRRERPDVVFCPAYTAPLFAAAPVVLTIHDVSFFAHPEWFSRREGWRRRLVTRAAARRASAVVTVSEFSAGEIARHVGLDPDRIHVVRHGIRIREAGPPDTREPLVLYVGSIFNRRHVPALLSAFAAVLQKIPDARLVIVGENRTRPWQDLAATAATLGLTGAVDLAEYVPEARLADLYARARVFVFVSEYEGFGLTPLEALASGVPPIVADTAVSREVCGEAALYVRPGDIAGLSETLGRLLSDEAERRRLLDAAPRILDRYSWARAADATWRILAGAAR